MAGGFQAGVISDGFFAAPLIITAARRPLLGASGSGVPTGGGDGDSLIVTNPVLAIGTREVDTMAGGDSFTGITTGFGGKGGAAFALSTVAGTSAFGVQFMIPFGVGASCGVSADALVKSRLRRQFTVPFGGGLTHLVAGSSTLSANSRIADAA